MAVTIQQLLSILKSNGYVKSNDDLGTYFNKGNRRFSCMKHGFNYLCYHNVKSGNEWALVNKSQLTKDYGEALKWVVIELQKNPL
ncbi:hypothetical protein D3C81_783890 [compost metagenome]